QPGDVRCGHARAALVAVTARRNGRAHAHTGRGHVRLEPAAAVYRHGTAAAEGGNRVAQIGRADGRGSVIDAGRLGDGAALWPGVARRADDDDSGGAHVLHDAQQEIPVGAAFAGRAGPRVADHVGGQRRVGVVAVQVGRRDEPLETFAVGRRRAHPLFHVAAANPARARRDADLVCSAIVADYRAHRVRAVAVVVTRHGRIEAARVIWKWGEVAVDSVVPVEVVVG